MNRYYEIIVQSFFLRIDFKNGSFNYYSIFTLVDIQPSISTPCTPSPCGANAICRVQQNAGSCSCSSDYIGNPYEGCRPECTLNSDCPSNQACIGLKCQDPCPGTCAQNAQCYTINHSPTCTCLERYTGNPFISCSLIVEARKRLFKAQVYLS